MIGYVYILINPAFPELIKIGRTSKSSAARALELSSTGTPGKFVVLFDVLVDDCVQVESDMHTAFSALRFAENREFFKVSPKQAIATLQDISKARVIDEKDWTQGSSQLSSDWRSDKVWYYHYCALVDCVDLDYRDKKFIVNKVDKLCRFGLVTLKFDVEGDCWSEEVARNQALKSLGNELIRYYSNFGPVDCNGLRVEVNSDAGVEFLYFLEIFEMNESRREILETIVKEIVGQSYEVDGRDHRKANGRLVYDAQTLTYMSVFGNSHVSEVYDKTLVALNKYYSDLERVDDDERRKNKFKAALLKKGNF